VINNDKYSRGRKGFTLVELLAVIVILAIILVIAVPKIMSVIEDSKKATLESTAKMIASSAEKTKIQNAILGKTDEITCDTVAKINKTDYASCSITFNDSGEAKVTIVGKGKFDNLSICNGRKTSATATEGGCGEICDEEEVYVQNVNVTKPYVVDYDACINYLGKKGFSESRLIRICKNRIFREEYYSFEYLVYDLINDEYFTEEELISNNIVASDSVFEENNITLGDTNSCVNYTKDVAINERGYYSEEELAETCSDVFNLRMLISNLLYSKIFTPEELVENNVVGSDSVFTNIKPGTACESKLKNIVVNEWNYTEEELQTLCSGKDIDVVTEIDYMLVTHNVSVGDLVENNVIEGTIEEEKVCVPEYANDAVTYINKLYNDTNVRSKFGLIKDNTSDENIRYSGKNVQNYVEFGNTGELWRIIGTFEVETADGNTEELVKIVRDESFKDSYGDIIGMSWDSSSENVNDGYGVNEWSQADLKTMLNTYYIGESTSCRYCYTSNQATCPNNCNSTVTQINSIYRNMIESVVWKTGAIEYNQDLSPLQAYNAERGNITGKTCSQYYDHNCNDTVERTTEWEGKIGLIYPSDFGYAGGSTCPSVTYIDCAQNNWVPNGAWNWTITSFAGYEAYDCDFSIGNCRTFAGGPTVVLGLDTEIGPATTHETNVWSHVNGVRPSLYLKSNVKIIDGDGSKKDPYKLSL